MKLTHIAAVAGVLASGLAVGLTPRTAQATTLNVTCSVANVAWSPFSSGEVQVNCGGSWYYGDNNGGCGTNGIDAVKAWESLAQASLLSGHKLYIEYTSGGTCISYMRLTNQ
jgi:hypothetical protein